MKQPLIIAAFTLIILFTMTSALREDNGRAGYVSSPGETTCNTSNCHNSFALNSGGGRVTSTSTMTNWNYEPGITYSITVTVGKTGSQLFGIGLEILDANNNNAGTLLITDPARTQIKSRTVMGVARRNVVHTLNGGASSDSCQFTFNWVAPATNIGPVTMYYCGNASNSNGQPTGDYIYSTNKIITPLNTFVDEFNEKMKPVVFPNPVADIATVNFFTMNSGQVRIILYDLTGKSVITLYSSFLNEGAHSKSIEIPSGCTTGTYMLAIETSPGTYTRKILVR